jgi:superfamily II DNA or RNA helicase
VLLAPIESSVIPLPHQLVALARAMAQPRVRYLLADEVGLGKTIEAGLILRELKLRGQVRRTLVIAPKGLVSQWVSEMHFHFGESFQLVLPEDIKTLSRIAPAASRVGAAPHAPNAWSLFAQVVVPMDSVKPMDRRRGWSDAQVDDHNRERFEDLVTAGWDLVIVDEAHRLGGSTDQVARFRLGQGLAEAAPYLLLLSATPHQGKTDAFQRLISLLDEQAFPDTGSVTQERVRPYVIRTEKRRAIDAGGNPLFKPRRTQLVPVVWSAEHRAQQTLYAAVTEYVREGYNQALREKRSYIGFLMILMQRLVVSSTSAIRTTLEKRLEALTAPDDQLMLFPLSSEEEWAELDGQEQIDVLLRTRLAALKNERAEVMLLLEAAARCEQAGPDVKAEALLEWLYRLQAEERDPELKALIFTEFVPTQTMLQRFLVERGFSVVCLNGSMEMAARKQVQESFAQDTRILISTDAGGEGLNLQFCHVVINYDMPWNPMRLEQRIGRVDRIGQQHVVRALNFVLDDSVEHRVQEVLEQKLAIILEEFGIDKSGDVLDSAQGGHMFDELYVGAILHPEQVEASVERVVVRVQEQARAAATTAALLGATAGLQADEAQRLLNHPLPHWVERMTVSYLRAHGGEAQLHGDSWALTWPDGQRDATVVFSSKEADRLPSARLLTLEEPKVRDLAQQLSQVVPGQPFPVVAIPGLQVEIQGIWSLWRIAITADKWNRERILPLFLTDTGRVFLPTARHIWDQLMVANPLVYAMTDAASARNDYDRLQQTAEEHGRFLFTALVQEQSNAILHEREKAEYAFAARRKSIARIGLPQVRAHRLHLVDQEVRNARAQLDQKARVYPEMTPLLILRVEAAHD